jgi:hypothetical protein
VWLWLQALRADVQDEDAKEDRSYKALDFATQEGLSFMSLDDVVTRQPARRSVGKLSSLTGHGGVRYLEVDAQAGTRATAGGTAVGTALGSLTARAAGAGGGGSAPSVVVGKKKAAPPRV